MTLRQQAATEALASALRESFVDYRFKHLFTLAAARDILAALPEGWTLTNQAIAAEAVAPWREALLIANSQRRFSREGRALIDALLTTPEKP